MKGCIWPECERQPGVHHCPFLSANREVCSRDKKVKEKRRKLRNPFRKK